MSAALGRPARGAAVAKVTVFYGHSGIESNTMKKIKKIGEIARGLKWTNERRTRAPRARRRSWRKLRFFRRQQPSTRRRRAREARSPATGISRLADAVGVSRRDVRLVAAIPAAAKTALAVAVAMLVAAAGFVFLVRDVRERHR